MNHNIDRSEWYKASARGSWYDQTPVSISATAAAPKKARKNRTGLKIFSITLCVLILIAATAFGFGSGGGNIPDTTPSAGYPGIWGGSGDNYDNYDDPYDFFSNYYTSSSGNGSNLERGETGTGVTLSLSSSDALTELTLQEIYDKCLDSVVSIVATIDGYDGYYWGSGIVMTEDGYILTNAHVIEGTDHATVCLSNGSEYKALLIGEDLQSDIAVLKIEATGLKAAEFGLSDELSVGDKAIAIGNPLGEEFSGTMTDGIISAINRGVAVDGHIMTLIQTNAALNEGNSGGPLINIYGQVVGITNMKMVADYSSATIEGIGFAIPTSTVKAVADELIASGAVTGRPSIGITARPVTAEEAEAAGTTNGIYVATVNEESDAYIKGITEGDIITAVNGIEVSSVNEVNYIKDNYKVGDTLTLTIHRGGEVFDVDIALYDASATN